jgi:phosphate transport system substrate-binding protein
MKDRLHALLVAVPLLLAAAACGSNSTGTSGSGASARNPAGPNTAPAASQIALSETGSSLIYPLFNHWGPAYHTKYPNVTITSESTGSGFGISQAATGKVDIGVSDAYLSDDDMSSHKGLMNIALAVSAQQINYNLPGVTDHLKLSGKVLAAIYQGTITNWNDPQITGLNPGVKLPAIPVVPLHRADESGDTFLFTQYLSKQDPDGWGKAHGASTSVDFPIVSGALRETGNLGMVTGCAKTPGCVAYIGISYLDQATQKGLGEAELGNASGNYLLPDAQSVQAEAASFSSTPANQAISLINGPAPNGYPIVNYEYAIVNSSRKDAATAQTIQAFLHWAVTDGNSAAFLDQVHFQPLPPAVAKLSDTQIATISG